MQDFHEEQALGTVVDARLFGRLLRYAAPYWRALAGCVVLLLLLAALKLSQPYLLKLAIDQVMQPGATASPSARVALEARLWPLAGIYLATVVLSSLTAYAQGLWLAITGQAIIARIRHDLFAHLQGLSLAFFDSNPVGRLVTRATNDVEALNEMYTSVLVNLFQDLFSVLGAIAVMLQMNWRLALVSFAVVPLVAISATIFQKLARKAWREVRVRLARINATLSEDFSGMRVVQIFAREARQSEEFKSIDRDYLRASMTQLNIFSVFRPLLELLGGLALVGVIWYGGHQVLAGILSFGTLYAFTSYNNQLFQPINALAEKYNVLQSALASAERIFQLLATEPLIVDRAPEEGLTRVELRVGHEPEATPPAVEFRDVWFAYKGEEWVLKGISFTVKPGQTVAFVGHTGAGKSTIMSLVARFYDVQRGAVMVDGRDVRDWPQADLRRRVGTVMQDVFLFAGDVAGNVALGDPAIDREAVEHAARVVGADAFIRRLPGGYDEPVVERGLTLSAGQRQLISFARALAYDPSILVLDEATASIDSETETALQHAMKAVARHRTTMVVAHRLSTIQDADRIYVMHHGEIREEGAHRELLARQGLYQRLWQLQFQGTGPLRA
ncbi:MAG TPA: ABC transporter ATP-binding protein [Oscillatoriaceae cyanobacterium]